MGSQPNERVEPSAPQTLSWSATPFSTGDDVRQGEFTAREFGRFQLTDLLGKGGFGVVYRAWDPQLEREVALKFPLGERQPSPKELDRFRREARAAAQLRHPGIVPVHDAGEIDGRSYIASDFVTGETLRRRIDRERKLSPREAARLVRSMAEALHFAHNKGIIHRDIKPENVLLSADGQPQITDFGLARRADAAEGQGGWVVGTPAYMSPEQARGDSDLADARSDLWSLGVILYELLCGRRPFSGATPAEHLERVQQDQPAPPRQVDTTIPADLEAICLRCLAKDSRDRYPSCQHLVEDLQRFERDEPVTARPIPPAHRAWRWCRRNPRLASLTTAASLLPLAVVIALLASAGYQAAVRAEDLERRQRELLEADAHFREAHVAEQRGDWRTALKELEAAEQAGHFDPLAVRLKRLDAWTALHESPRVREEVARFATLSEVGPHRGSILLWQAEIVAFDGQHDEAQRLVREALASGLPPARESYARGLIAENGPQAIAAFYEAQARDPMHLRSIHMLCMELFFAGRHAEARGVASASASFFPDDANLIVFIGMLDAAEGRLPAALGRLDEARQALGEEVFELGRTICTLIDDVRRGILLREPKAVPRALAAGLPLAGRLLSSQRLGPTFRLPYRYRELLSPVLKAQFASTFTGSNEPLIAAYRQIQAIHPDGLWALMEAAFLVESGRWAEADAAALRAAELPSILPETPRLAMLVAALAAWAEWKTNEADRRPVERAAAHARRAYELGLLNYEETWMLAMLAMDGKDYALARRILSEFLAENPNHRNGRRVAIVTEWRDGNPMAAAKLADAAAYDDPNFRFAPTVFKDAPERVRAWLQAWEQDHHEPFDAP